MAGIANPMDAFLTLQGAIDDGEVQLHPCEIHRDLHVLVDHPNDEVRITYVMMTAGRVQAIAQFCQADPVGHVPCFSAGVAVDEDLRGKGLAGSVVSKGLEELRHGLNRNGVGDYFVEAVVSVSNIPSNRLATRVFSDSPKRDTDFFSGEPVFQYLKLFPGAGKRSSKMSGEREDTETPPRAPHQSDDVLQRLGRNDPCWCGAERSSRSAMDRSPGQAKTSGARLRVA